jgi:hypothetical protein
MKSICFFLLLVLLTAEWSSAQPPDSLWSRVFGGNGDDWCRSARQAMDGSYYLAGTTNSFGAGVTEFWLLKTDASGHALWSEAFGGIGGDEGESVYQTSDGGYILLGETSSFGAGGYDFWVVKTDVDGDSLWSRTFGGSGTDYGFAIRQTLDGGYILAGTTSSFGAGNYDFWLVKTDADGDVLWSRTFGGSGGEQCRCVQQTQDGGYVLGGWTTSFGAGNVDFWLVKTDANGDSLWSRTFGGSNPEVCNFVQQTSDGGYVLAGSTSSFGSGSYDFWLVKTDSDGDLLWSRTFGGNSADECQSALQTSEGGFILAGYTNSFGAGYSDFWLVKTDANGDSVWSRTFGGGNGDVCYSAWQTSDGGYVLAGTTNSFGTGSYDFWLVKTGPESPAEPLSISLPSQYALHSNWPNPFNPATQITYDLKRAGYVSVQVFDILGQHVATLTDEMHSAGSHSVLFDGSNLASGIYLYRLQAGDFTATKKMVLLK